MQIPMIPNLLQLTIMNILCETMRSRLGSQTPDLGFVLLPLYDAILPHLNWHLYMAFGNMMVRPASMRRRPFESASDACCPRNRPGCDCISYRFVLDSHINPPPLHFGGDPRGKHFMQVLERTFTRHAQS